MIYQEKSIIEKGAIHEYIIKVRVFSNLTKEIKSVEDVKRMTENQKKDGWVFLKSWRENGIPLIAFCSEKDFELLCGDRGGMKSIGDVMKG